MKFINWIKSFFEIEEKTSSKRLVSILASIALIAYLFMYPSDAANNSVLILALGSLGITGYEKVMTKK